MHSPLEFLSFHFGGLIFNVDSFSHSSGSNHTYCPCSEDHCQMELHAIPHRFLSAPVIRRLAALAPVSKERLLLTFPSPTFPTIALCTEGGTSL